jgi:putative ATP-dependent endonuclease of OLD family
MHILNIKLWNYRKFGSENEIDLEKPNLDLNPNSALKNAESNKQL